MQTADWSPNRGVLLAHLMSWLVLSLLSALFLGLYEVAKKLAVRDNAVVPVLFGAVVTGAVLWIPFVIWSAWSPTNLPASPLRVAALTPYEHLHLFGKSLLIGVSWAMTYAALKHLPISIASPIRSTGPLWTIVMATGVWGERPSVAQWAGILAILVSFYAYSCIGRLEGIHFHRDRWVLSMLAATFLSACSGLYDKYLLQQLQLDASTVQAWFSIDLVIVLLPSFVAWWRNDRASQPLDWRWSIVAIGLFLLVADFLYFSAITHDGALISLISPLRRLSIVVTFASGYFLFEELHLWRKAICLLVLLAGVALISWP